jgi:hypothetical protein
MKDLKDPEVSSLVTCIFTTGNIKASRVYAIICSEKDIHSEFVEHENC